jgi:hypothetical protein
VLTHLDPLAYGIDPIRRVILMGSGVPTTVTDSLAISIGGQVLPIPLEAGLVLVFGILMLGLAIYNFRARD